MSEATPGASVLLTTETLGHGDDELGLVLMHAFLRHLAEAGTPPARVVCVNGGARLTTAGSPHLASLSALEARGTEILTCGTCLDWFELRDDLAVGRPTTMAESVAALLGGGVVIRP